MALEYNGEVGCELAEQPGSVEPQRVENDLDDVPVADLETMTERAVDDVVPPVVCQALDVGELVHQSGSGKNSTSNDGVTADQFDAEKVVVRAGHTISATGEDLSSVATDLFTTNAYQL